MEGRDNGSSDQFIATDMGYPMEFLPPGTAKKCRPISEGTTQIDEILPRLLFVPASQINK